MRRNAQHHAGGTAARVGAASPDRGVRHAQHRRGGVPADRIVIMTPRPGQIRRIIKIDLPRPRETTAPQFSDTSAKFSAKFTEDISRLVRG